MNTMLRRRAMMAGAEPSPLVFYDKLVFDGTAYIATDLIPQADSSFAVIIGEETVKGFQAYFSMKAGTNAYTAVNLGTNSTSTNRYFSVFYGSASALSTNRYIAWSSPFLGFYLTPKKFGWGTAGPYSITKGANNPSGPLVIGNNPTGTSAQPFTGSIGTFYVFDSTAQDVTSYSDLVTNHTPYITLRPCTYNGVPGLWYVEGNRFFGNSGGGNFTVYNIS